MEERTFSPVEDTRDLRVLALEVREWANDGQYWVDFSWVVESTDPEEYWECLEAQNEEKRAEEVVRQAAAHCCLDAWVRDGMLGEKNVLIVDGIDPCTGEVLPATVPCAFRPDQVATSVFHNGYFLWKLYRFHGRPIGDEFLTELRQWQTQLLHAWRTVRPLTEGGKCARCEEDLTAETTWKVVQNGEVKIPEEHRWLKRWVGKTVCPACGRFLRAYCEVEGIYVVKGDKHRHALWTVQPRATRPVPLLDGVEPAPTPAVQEGAKTRVAPVTAAVPA
ncbi:hypothetical protein L6258_01835 [Candidatus Parcubacteria bacterium]|nr:hypothetical protein [Candidatus Parcubacteria bacterium]